MIGTAASAIQIIPSIAKQVDKCYVYQRTPNWILPKENFEYLPWQKFMFQVHFAFILRSIFLIRECCSILVCFSVSLSLFNISARLLQDLIFSLIFQYVPFAMRIYRMFLYTRNEGIFFTVAGPWRAKNLDKIFGQYIHDAFSDKELAKKLTPNYDFGIIYY